MFTSDYDTTYKPVSFSAAGYILKGSLHLPAVTTPPVVIGSHGLFSTGDSPKQLELAKRCTQSGIAFFRFDHRGCGQSDGVFEAVTSLDARCNDLLCAIKTVQKRKDVGNKIGLFGSSMGGAVVISVASQMDVDSLVTVAAPVFGQPIIDALKKSNAPDKLPTALVKKGFRSDLTETLSSLHHILIFHGDSDELIPPSNALEIYEKAGHPKKLVMQSGGDHRMSNVDHQEIFIKEAVNWFNNCFNGTMT